MDVVCGTDLSTDARNAAETAGAVASRTGGRLVLAHGLELPSIAYVAGDVVLFPPSLTDPELVKKETALVLGIEAKRVAAITGAAVEARVEVGPADSVLLEIASRAKAGMIVVGSHGRRAPIRWILGSTAERLTVTSPVPVLVTRGSPAPLLEWAKKTRPLRVLLAAEFDDAFSSAAQFTTALFGADDVEIHVAHACELSVGDVARIAYAPPMPFRQVDLEASATTALRRMTEAAGLALRSGTSHILWGKAAATLAHFAKEGRFDVVVAGTHGRRGLDRALLGSVAHGLLRRCAVPVLVVPIGK